MSQHDEFDETELRALLEKAQQLSRESAPAPEAWAKIRDRIDNNRVREIAPFIETARHANSDVPQVSATPATAASTTVNAPWYRNTRVMFSAAAALFVAVTTLVVARDRVDARTGSIVAIAAETLSSDVSSAKPASASIAAVFAQYDEATADLTNDLNQRRSRLQPEAVAVLDSCLVTMDRAIQESRKELLETPDNTTIADLLQLTYQQKLDLLRRATELPLGSH